MSFRIPVLATIGRLGLTGAVFCLLSVSAADGGSLLDEAVEYYRLGELNRAEDVLATILSRPAPPQEDAAMFLLIRIHLARGDGAKAADLAERFFDHYPESSYLDDAHYARAEALFLSEELIACAQELLWVVERAADSRLREKALKVLPHLTERSRTSRERERVEEITAALVPVQPMIPRGAVLVLLAFPEQDAPEARALRQSMEFAASRGASRFPVAFREVTSSYECVETARRILADGNVRLLVFAGDEGSATALALLSGQYEVPVLMLTGYAHSLTSLSDYVFDFLPSRETQGFALGEYAADYLEVQSALELVVSDEEGQALEKGFRAAVETAGAAVEAVEWYSPTAPSVRALLRELFTPSRGTGEEGSPLSTALTDSEMAALWGSSTGEVLLLKEPDSLRPPPTHETSGKRALFFGIPSGRAGDMASQMGTLPRRTMLLGNSAWIDPGALKEFPEVCDGLVVSAPLSPEVEAPGLVQQVYEDSVARPASLWELLGFDAAAFIATILTYQPDSPGAMRQALLSAGPFSGFAVRVDFEGGRQNRAVRILRYEHEAFTVLR
jgi:ABC-type branched-subunit amino acid transport system substrate-binding protein